MAKGPRVWSGRYNTIDDVLYRIVPCEPTVLETGCWEWSLGDDGTGYGISSVGGEKDKVHRIVWRHFRGEIPEGLELDHLCRNRICCNPDHLEPVTHQENMKRGIPGQIWEKKREQTRCKNGHEFTPENTYTRASDGKRKCKACNVEVQRRFRERNPERARELSRQSQARRRAG